MHMASSVRQSHCASQTLRCLRDGLSVLRNGEHTHLFENNRSFCLNEEDYLKICFAFKNGIVGVGVF